MVSPRVDSTTHGGNLGNRSSLDGLTDARCKISPKCVRPSRTRSSIHVLLCTGLFNRGVLMRHRAPLFAALALLSACTEQVWTKPGASTRDFYTDRAMCYQSANVRYPTPQPTGYNTTANCSSYSTCSGTATQDTASVGANLAATIGRNADFHSCMQGMGWRLVDKERARSVDDQRSYQLPNPWVDPTKPQGSAYTPPPNPSVNPAK